MPPSSTSPVSDVLSALLREMRLDSVAYRRLELRAPWSVAFEQAQLRAVHIVVSGRCEMVLAGERVRAVEPGDLLLAPRADPHVLRSPGEPRAATIPSAALPDADARGRIRAGGRGEETVIVCGAFIFHAADHPALAALPRVIHLSGGGGRPRDWLRAYVDALDAETRAPGPGSDVIMARLSDALVARALRHHAEADGAGWLGALRDPGVARALAAMHGDLRRGWTLASLARVAGLSRSAFVERFRALVGETPMRHLLARRMRHVMTILDDADATLAAAAASAGYASEAALAVAFKRHTGITPGAYRRRLR